MVNEKGDEHYLTKYLGLKTNNQAEYEALILGLEKLKNLKANEVEDARPIEPEMRDQLKQVSLQMWLLTERQNHRVKVCFGSGGGGSCSWQYDWLVKRLINAQ